MKNYIIFDLEWNQSPRGREDSVADFPFEIIEIGAVKLDENFQMVDEFHRRIRPQVYAGAAKRRYMVPGVPWI